MTGPDYDPFEDDDGPEEFRPVPHPDDRLWRHPSEIAAMQAAHANAPTAKVPAVILDDEPTKSRVHVGLMLAAGLVAVGAAALTIGVISSDPVGVETQIASPTSNTSPETSEIYTASTNTGLAIEVVTQGEERLAARVHAEIATSLPRVQAATADGMREGSGFFVTEDGHIATSAALIDGARYILAWTDDDQRWKASIVATDPISDIAIIQIETDDWPAVSLGGGVDLRAGQYALALDHVLDEISIGEITTIGSPLVEVDQPAATPGSAIIDDAGVVIAMMTSDGTNSHATPAWMLEQVAVDLISSGTTSHSFLGVRVESHPTHDGMVLVSEVIADSPAAHAGIRNGDLIDSLNGTTVTDAASLFRQLQDISPGEEAVLTVTRGDSRRIILATIAELAD